MAKCTNCGSEQDGKFCEECGEKISAESGGHGKHAVAIAVPILAVGLMFLLLTQGSTPASAVEAEPTSSVLEAPTGEVVATPTVIETKETETLIASIDGMTCGSCVADIERKLGALDGIDSVEVILSQKKGIIEYDSSVIDKQAILDAITSYGYSASEVSNSLSKEAQPSAAPAKGSTCGSGGGGCGCGG